MRFRGFGLGHKLPGGFYGRAYFGSGSSRGSRRKRGPSVIVHLTGKDLVAIQDQKRKETALTWKIIGWFLVICLLAWPIASLDTHPFVAWPLLILEIIVGILVATTAFDQWKRAN